MILPAQVHEVLKRHMLADGFPVVFDLDRSRGPWLRDARTGDDYLDFFTCFASWPVGYNHPALFEKEFLVKLQAASLNNPSNADLYTTLMAEFVQAFATEVTPKGFPHHFWISGGALAVENALKTAFDWKARKIGLEKVSDDGASLAVLHFRSAFHGRSGYTMSLTNTVPAKTALFPKFPWPRVHNPAIEFDLDGGIANDVAKEEERACREIEAAFAKHGNRIAAIIIEPMQGEGGDNHFRPEFLARLRRYADEREALLVFDEVQTGFFGSGKPWMWQIHGVAPDVVAFGKKTQVCGIYASARVDEVEGNVFQQASRINSTWAGTSRTWSAAGSSSRSSARRSSRRTSPSRDAGSSRAAELSRRSAAGSRTSAGRIARGLHAREPRGAEADARRPARKTAARPRLGGEGDPLPDAVRRVGGRDRRRARAHRGLPAGARPDGVARRARFATGVERGGLPPRHRRAPSSSLSNSASAFWSSIDVSAA
jgi:L-lysine 6-transaminase